MTNKQSLWENAKETSKHEVLFKYYNMKTGLSALEESTLQFSHPSRFNDPFDCNLSLFKITEQDTDAYYNYIFEKHAKGNKELEIHFEKMYQEKVRPNFKKYIEDIIEKENSDRGISCFSKISNNLLMWAYYAANHTGICIGYDTLKLRDFIVKKNRESAFLNINYVTEIEPKMHFLEKEHSISYWLTTKSVQWQYEQEIRLISRPFQFGSKKSIVINIPNDIIRDVTLGYSFDDQTKLDAIDLISSKLPHVEIFQIKPNYQTFELERHKINK